MIGSWSYRGPHVILTPDEVRSLHKLLAGIKPDDEDLVNQRSMREKVDEALGTHPVFREPVP